MQISIDNPDRLEELVGFLRAGGCIALRLDEHTVEAIVPHVASPLSEQRELDAYVKSFHTPAASRPRLKAAAPATSSRALAVAA